MRWHFRALTAKEDSTGNAHFGRRPARQAFVTFGTSYRRGDLMASSLVALTKQARALDGPLPCHRENSLLWFSELPADLQLAKVYCQPCPLRRVCLAGAIERHEPHGVWGGEIFARGAIITEKRPRGRPPRDAGLREMLA
jgi:WhiB family transcriptional regulator, redox-sensing transcriptional regulator